VKEVKERDKNMKIINKNEMLIEEAMNEQLDQVEEKPKKKKIKEGIEVNKNNPF